MVCLKAVLTYAHVISLGEIKGTQLTNRTIISHLAPYGLPRYAGITFYPKMNHELSTPFDGIDVLGFCE
jgi:hypothetical protein